MPWSIFTDGGGDGAALTWDRDLLQKLGDPDNPSTEQFIFDWEKSEGGGGKYNPLNQGPVPGDPSLTTTGSQYGGGAADYVSWDAGLQGAVDYLNMPNYTAVKAALMSGNGAAARNALIQSPWAASHYGYGSSFSNAPVPGQASALPGYTGNGSSTGTANVVPASFFSSPFWQGLLSGLTGLPFGSLSPPNIKDLIERLGLILLGAALVIIGLLRFTEAGKSFTANVIGVTSGGRAGGSSKQVDREYEKSVKNAAQPEGEKNQEGNGE